MMELINVLFPLFGSPTMATFTIFSCRLSLSLLEAFVERNRGLIRAQMKEFRFKNNIVRINNSV